MIRVLFVLPNLQGGGAERVALDLVRHLDRRDFRPCFFLLKDEGQLRDSVPDDVPVRAGNPRRRLCEQLPWLLSAIMDEARRNDVVVGALELDATFAACAAARVARRPFVAWVHTVLDRFLEEKAGRLRAVATRLLYPRFPVVVVPSAAVGASLRRRARVSEGRIVEIPNLLDLDRVTRLAAEPVALDLNDAATVVAVGRLDFQKGFDLLLEAHARLRRRGIEHRLVIVGEGPNRRDLELKAATLGVADSVIFPGFLKNPYPLMQAARVFVLSSRFEGFGMALLEALALSVPVVSTDCGAGPREILADGRFGRLVPPEDPEALARAIEEALRENAGDEAARRSRMQRVLEFVPDRIVPRWEALFRQLVS
ncbi:MAG: glycosyltransferase [Armatimonadota bacterium]|nr:glycosyltransferase [Armatimonadota bacterium]MDR7450408.1 glycosyltransferase [Armatimonadota bacterium]MDR7467009.1 glycosyltransferase [Armatimonadota bacterium]MDR7493449.1 glycosyltransferase [Armatimonadota bacterium]MDR7498714.1 glycosyltransferase [Armatimonadota bacterium]